VPCSDAGANQVLVAGKKCCPEIEYYPLPGSSHPEVYDFGVGEPTNGWLEDYYQAQAIRTPPRSEEDTYGFFSSSGNRGETTACVKYKRGMECCAVQGVDCGTFAQVAVSSKEYLAMADGRTFAVVTNPYTQCWDTVYEVVPCEPIGSTTCRRIGLDGVTYDPWKYDCIPDGDKCLYELQRAAPGDANYPLQTVEGGEGVTNIAVPGSGCGQAVIKTGEDTGWLFLLLGLGLF
jgi:hypothetical protein